MKKLFFPVAAILVLAACNDQSKQDTAKTDTTAANQDTTQMKVQIPNSGCYLYASGKDTVALKVEVFPNVVTGTLRYDFYEKDGSQGALDGTLHGDTLIAEYNFMAEGTRSIRQVAFLIKDSVVVEGYGDQEEKEGKMVFRNVGQIDFSKGTKMRKISCQEYDPAMHQ